MSSDQNSSGVAPAQNPTTAPAAAPTPAASAPHGNANAGNVRKVRFDKKSAQPKTNVSPLAPKY